MAGLTAALGQRLVYAALGAVVALLAIGMFTTGGSDYKNGREILTTVARLKAAGWTPAHGTSPLIKDRPRGSRPVAVVQGAVRYPALEPGKAPDIGVDAVPPSRSPMSGADPFSPDYRQRCDDAGVLDRIAVDVKCRMELIESDLVPAARLFVAGRLQLGGSVRELPETRVEDVRLDIDLPPRLPRQIALGVGLSTRPSLIVNGSFFREGRRVGWWGQYESEPGDWQAAGGVTVRF